MKDIITPLAEASVAREMHIRNILLTVDGKIVQRYDFQPLTRRLLYSASKTFTSMAVGLAAAEGKLRLDDKVCGYFEEYAPFLPGFEKITVENLLTMSSGHGECPIATAGPGEAEDFAKCFFGKPLQYGNGTRFVYNNAGTYLLSRIVSKVTGSDICDYLDRPVFSPLGIKDVRWTRDNNGCSIGYSGLYLDAEELSRFGQLVMDDGKWRGRQLLPADYVRNAKAFHISTKCIEDEWATPDSLAGYGYQLWMNSYPGSVRMDGYHGQYCVLIPDKNAIVTYISDEPKKMLQILALTWEFVTPNL